MARFRLFTLSLSIVILFTGCQFLNNANQYKDTAKVFMEALLHEKYDSCINLIALDHPLMINTNAEQMKQNMPALKQLIVNNWGDKLEYTFMSAEKKFSTVERKALPANTTVLQMQFSNDKEFGVVKFLFDDKSKKILRLDIEDIKAPIPSMVLFWMLTPLALCVPVFMIYVIRQIKRSDMRRKWLKYIAVLFLNAPSITYGPLYGFSIKPLMFKILFGFGFSYQGYTNTALEIGLPLGALYWFWRLKRRNNDTLPTDDIPANEQQKNYRVLLDGEEIGTTMLEHADAPMGVVFGALSLHSITTPYHFFRNYCSEHGVQVSMDDTAELFISTYNIPGMQIVTQDGIVIKGISTYVSGADTAFEVYVEGIASPFYEEQFPHHVSDYKNQ